MYDLQSLVAECSAFVPEEVPVSFTASTLAKRSTRMRIFGKSNINGFTVGMADFRFTVVDVRQWLLKSSAKVRLL